MGKKAKYVETPPVTILDVQRSAKNQFDLDVKLKLFKMLGETTYKSWFKYSDFEAVRVDKNVPVFRTKGKYFEDYLNNVFGRQIKQAFGLSN